MAQILHHFLLLGALAEAGAAPPTKSLIAAGLNHSRAIARANANLSLEVGRLHALIQEIEAAERGVNVSEADVEKCKEEMDRAKERIREAKQRIKVSQATVAASFQRFEDVRGRHSHLKGSVDALNAELQAQINQASQLDSIVTEFHAKLAGDERELREARSSVQDQAMKLRRARDEVLAMDAGPARKAAKAAVAGAEDSQRDAIASLTARTRSWEQDKRILANALNLFDQAQAVLNQHRKAYNNEKSQLDNIERMVAERDQDYQQAKEILRSNRENYTDAVQHVIEEQETQAATLREWEHDEIAKEHGKEEAIIARIKKEHSTEVAAMREAHAGQVRDMTGNHTEQVETILGRHVKELQDLREQHAADIKMREAQHNQSMSAKEIHIADIKRAAQDRLESLKGEHASEVKTLRGGQEVHKEALRHQGKQLDRMREVHMHAVEAMRDSQANYSVNVLEEHQQQLGSLRDGHGAEIQALRDAHAAQMDRLEKSHEEHLNGQEQRHNSHVKGIQDALWTHLDQLEEQVVVREDVIRQRDEEIDSLVKAQKEQLKLQQQHENKSAAQAEDGLKKVHEQLETAIAAREQEINRLVDLQASEIKERDEELDHLHKAVSDYDAWRRREELATSKWSDLEKEASAAALQRALEVGKQVSSDVSSAVKGAHDELCNCVHRNRHAQAERDAEAYADTGQAPHGQWGTALPARPPVPPPPEDLGALASPPSGWTEVPSAIAHPPVPQVTPSYGQYAPVAPYGHYGPIPLAPPSYAPPPLLRYQDEGEPRTAAPPRGDFQAKMNTLYMTVESLGHKGPAAAPQPRVGAQAADAAAHGSVAPPPVELTRTLEMLRGQSAPAEKYAGVLQALRG